MSRRNIWSLLGVTILGSFIFYYIFRDIPLSVLMNDFKTINWWWMVLAIACILLYFGLEAVITKILVGPNVKGFTAKDAIRVPLVEQLFNGITPFSSGGQPGQLLVMVQSGVEGGKASSTLLMKFVVYQGMIVINFLISLLIGFHYIVDKLSYLAIFVIFGFIIHLLVIIGLLLIMYWHSFTKKLVSIIIVPAKWFINERRFKALQNKLDAKIDTFYLESVRIAHQWKLLAKIIVITFFQLIFYYLIPYFIMLGLGYHNINIIMILSLHVLIVMVISMFPIPGGAGGAEYSFEMLFKSYISSNSKLVLAMAMWRLLTYYLGMILGVIALFIKPDKVKKKK